MNETISINESISTLNMSTAEKIKLITDKMLEIRPRGEVSYKYYFKNEALNFRPVLRALEVDLFKIYPDAKEYDCTFAGISLTAPRKETITVSIWGKVRVCYQGEEILCAYDDQYDFPLSHLDITLQEGYNELMIECICKNGYFGFWLLPSMPFYRGMWAKDYLFCTRTTIPVKGFVGEEGVAISKLYPQGAKEEQTLLQCRKDFRSSKASFVYPSEKPTSNEVLFNNVFNDEKGFCAYAYSRCTKNCVVNFTNDSPIKIFVNQKEILSKSACGNFNLGLKTGDEILVKSIKTDGGWGFSDNAADVLSLDFIESNRENKEKWLLLGAFGSENCIDLKYGPEYGIDFTRIYQNENKQRIYWRFSEESTYLRAYLDSSFYSQWYYALMVGHYGLRIASETLKNENYRAYFVDSMTNMAQYFDYMRYDREMFGDTTFMPRCVDLEDWDNIGTMGMNLCDVYHITGDGKILSVIERLVIAYKENIPRFEDGTFHRHTTMWADDLYMCCPFLVGIGSILGDEYYHEAVRQILGFKKKLYMEDKKIFSHIFFIKENKANRVPWGRGNGWIAVAISEVLMNIPENFECRDKVLGIFKEFAQGISSFQDENGMWRQVMDIDTYESYPETSATAMFTLALARGVRLGWIDKSYIEIVKKAWSALQKRAIDKDGNIYGVCKGSGCNMEMKYYFTLDTVCNDDHGTGIIIAAACEIEKLGL